MTITLLIWFFLPSLLMVVFSLSSLAAGLLAASGLILSILMVRRESIKLSKSFLFFFGLSLFWVILNPYSIGNLIQPKQIFSIFALLFCGLSVTSMLHGKSDGFEHAIKLVFWVLIFVGYLGVVDFFSPGNYRNLNKPLFPFSEPSHFALVYAPISCAYLVVSSKRMRFIVCALSFFLALLLPNLTLLAITLMLLGVALSVRQVLGFSFISLLIGTVLINSDFISLEYFISRLGESPEENISRLVYLQGWESMFSALEFSNGFGVGYQNLGIEPSGNASAILDGLTVSSLNRSDGSFLAAKLIGEFGFIGIFFVLVLFFNACRSGFLLRKKISNFESPSNMREFVPLCFGYMVLIEIFVRGVGYFSPTFMIYLVFLPKIIRVLKENKKSRFSLGSSKNTGVHS